jgi:uncharacterized membrane protein YqiK
MIGRLLAVAGMMLAWFVSIGLGTTLFVIGVILVALSLVIMIYLWLSEHWLPKARRESTACV